MRRSYLVRYFIPILEAPELFRKFTIEVTRPSPLTKGGIQRVLRNQLQIPELVVADFKPIKTDPQQFDLFIPVSEVQVTDADSMR